MALFTIGSLKNNYKNKFKILKNARQLYFTGCAIMTDDRNIVLVEGSAKNVRFYKRLLLERLTWEQDGEAASAREREFGILEERERDRRGKQRRKREGLKRETATKERGCRGKERRKREELERE